MSKLNSQVTTLDDAPATTTSAAAASAAPSVVRGANHDTELSGKKRTITIHASADKDGNDAVSVGLNGYAYQIPRGKPFEVPEEVVEVLENAVVTSFETGEKGVVVERSSPRYAMSVR